MDLLIAAALVATLLASAALGARLRQVLPGRHTSADTIEAVRVLMGMLFTFSALVLGLLTSSAKQRFDEVNTDLATYAASIVELDHRLAVYGPETDPLRTLLRRYTAAAIADTWPGEPRPSGDYPTGLVHAGPGAVEDATLGTMLADLDLAIERLAPTDPFHDHLAERLRTRAALTIQQRWQLIFSARATLSWPFLAILTAWLAIIFAIFGLTAPRNTLVATATLLAAISIASPVYLIIDYADGRTGFLQLSSLPLRVALAHIDANPPKP